MTQLDTPPTPPSPTPASTPRDTSVLRDLIKLARPHQWAKGAFVVIGPAYAVAQGTKLTASLIWGVAAAFMAFAFASSSCYILNDLRDAEADRNHPRKRHRPIASGRVSPGLAKRFSTVLAILAGLAVALVPVPVLLGLTPAPTAAGPYWPAAWLGLVVLIYILNTNFYSIRLKHHAVADVISLALGFVLRVLGGCAAAAVAPSSWLLNVTFFIAMFLAFGKRLGERRTLGDNAAAARRVQQAYTDDLLRMAVVVTAVATLVTYAGYVQAQGAKAEVFGFNLLWFTMLPATYGLLRSIVLLERGVYDDPTELASHDRPFQVSALVFALLTAATVAFNRTPSPL